MLNRIIEWSLGNRLIVIGAALAAAIVGSISLLRLEIDAFPDTTPVQVQINTSTPALSPEEVERQVTRPVEQALGGLPSLREVRSISKFGLSQVVATFDDGTDIYFARGLILERLSAVELPEGFPRPVMGPVSTGLGEVFHYILAGGGEDPTAVRTLQDWTVKPALRSVPGVAEVNGWGGYEKEYQVRFDPARLLQHGISLDELIEAILGGNLNVGGGSIVASGEMLIVQGIGRVSGIREIEEIVVASRGGIPIRVRDLADVAIGHRIRQGAVTASGEGEALLGLGFMLMGENSRDVARRLRDRFQEIRKSLPGNVKAEVVYDRTELVDQVIDTVRKNLFEGGLLVIAVLFAFLGNLRAGLIVAIAIPFSMLFAATGMLRFGIAGSLLSLGALDFGLIVDSSVIVVENAVRHLSRRGAAGGSRAELVRDASLEVLRPTMFGALIILIVYLPILTLEGIEGKLFRPMALTVIFALLGSLILSVTLMPVLASLVLPRRIAEKEPLAVRLSRKAYAPLLGLALKNRIAVLGLALLLLGAAAMAARNVGSEFIPRLSEGSIVVNIVRLPGTDIGESIRLNTQMERSILRALPDEVEHAWSRIGTAEVATDPMGVELSDIFLALKPRESWKRARTQDELAELVRAEIRDIPGQRIALTQPIEMRINELISGIRLDLAVKIFGDDYGVLMEKAREAERVLESIEGAADVTVEQVSGQPVLEVRLLQDELARYGIRARAVLDLVEAIGGKPLGEVTEGQLRFPLALRLPEKLLGAPEALGGLILEAPGGERIPLSRLASIRAVEGPSTITREWGQRRITVQCNVRGRDVGSFVREAREKVPAQVKLPPERYRIGWGGQFENLERARARLSMVVPMALALILGLLWTSLGSLRLALLVFTGVPLAATGGIASLWVREMPFSISAGVGFIALSGVAVLNGLVMVTFIRQLQGKGLGPEEAVVEGSLARLRPVLMTALVASLGFLPMALARGMGAEVQRPLATVVIGGVLSSTLLTMIVIPVLYRWFAPSHR